MKKLIAIVLVALMCLSILASCTPAEPDEPNVPETNETDPKEDPSEPKDDDSSEPEDDDSSEPDTDESSSTPDASEYDVEAALEYLDTLYKKEYPDTVTAADYQLVGQIMIGLDKYLVAWTVDNDKVNAVEGSPYWTIEVDEMSKETFNYNITATVTAPDGTTGTVSYERTVKEFIVTSFEDYMAAESGEIVTVAGIVVAINAKSAGNTRNHLFLADVDGKGGYYCYQLDQDPLEAGVEVGMTVAVTAPASPYSGMQETKGGDFVIVDKTIKTVEVKDLTDVFATADLKPYVGLVVTLKGVTIGNQELGGTSDYLKFTLNGKESYIRTYVTDFPTTLKAEDKATIDAAHAANFGNTADVTGVLVLYSGNPYLIPMTTDCFSNYTVVTKTDAEKVAAEKEALEIGASFSDNTVIELPSVGKYYDSISITWATEDTTGAAVIADGKLTLTVPEEATTVTVTATIKSGDATETKTFEIALSKAPVTIPEALEIPDGSNVLVSGTVVEINTAWSDQYNNISVTIADAEGNKLYLYRLATKVVVGDVITVKGQMGTYNGARQVAAGATATIDEAAPIEVSLSEAVKLDDGTKVIVKGTVKEINTAWSEQYGNITVTIEDAEGNTLYIFRLATNVAVGDVVTITGKVGSYNGSKQIAAGATAVIENGEGTPDTDVITTIPGALAAEDGTAVIIKGTVTEINTAWSEQYGNITVTITDNEGNELYVYRLATNVAVGDVVTITGKVGSYNGSKQIAAGATAVIESGEGEGEGDTTTPSGEATIPEVLASEDGTSVVVSGTVTKINTAWSDQYNNITVTITDNEGNELYVYRLATNVAVGDIITVTGTVGSYNGAKQIAAGATAEKKGTHTEHIWADATCTAPKSCILCDATEGDVRGHIDANSDNICDDCKANTSIVTAEETFEIAANAGTLGDKVITWNAENFTVVGAQAGSTNAIRTSDSDHYRVYAKSTLTISGTGMTKIVFTATSASYATVLAGSLTTAGATATADGNIVTVTVNDGTLDEIAFTASAQTRISKIVVTYVED